MITGRAKGGEAGLAEPPDLRGSMVDGYDDDRVNSALGRLSEASGLNLVCVWEYFDSAGVGGNSDFFVLADDGRLYELAGNLWRWLNGPLDDPDTPADLDPPTAWLGAVTADRTEDFAWNDGFRNYATEYKP